MAKAKADPKKNGAPYGNRNRASSASWAHSIRLAIKTRSLAEQKQILAAIAEVLIDKALDGNMEAIKEIGDRIDGKSTQMVLTNHNLTLTHKLVSDSLKFEQQLLTVNKDRAPFTIEHEEVDRANGVGMQPPTQNS